MSSKVNGKRKLPLMEITHVRIWNDRELADWIKSQCASQYRTIGQQVMYMLRNQMEAEKHGK